LRSPTRCKKSLRLIVLLLDRRGKKRRGSMERQAKQDKQKKAG
jgi:hypothetical protein